MSSLRHRCVINQTSGCRVFETREGFETLSSYVTQQPQISSEATNMYSRRLFSPANRKAVLLMKGHDMTLKIVSLARLLSVLYLTDSCDTAKVNLGLVVYALQKYTVYLTSPGCWVMTSNDYSNAQCLGYCTRRASKQACCCLFEFSILYCHVSLGCLEFTGSDGSFPSALSTHREPAGRRVLILKVETVCMCVSTAGDNGTQSAWQMSYFITVQIRAMSAITWTSAALQTPELKSLLSVSNILSNPNAGWEPPP